MKSDPVAEKMLISRHTAAPFLFADTANSCLSSASGKEARPRRLSADSVRLTLQPVDFTCSPVAR